MYAKQLPWFIVISQIGLNFAEEDEISEIISYLFNLFLCMIA